MTRWRKAQQSLSIRAQLADWHFSTKVRRMHLDVEMIEAVTEKGAISHPKWKQGDPDFYTRDNIAKRLSLRRDALVSDTLQKWWKVMQNTFAVSEKVPCVCLTEDQFVVVLRKIAKTLLAADEYDKDDVEQAAREDWAVDSCGQEQMTREMFMDALFELCGARAAAQRQHRRQRRPRPARARALPCAALAALAHAPTPSSAAASRPLDGWHLRAGVPRLSRRPAQAGGRRQPTLAA